MHLRYWCWWTPSQVWYEHKCARVGDADANIQRWSGCTTAPLRKRQIDRKSCDDGLELVCVESFSVVGQQFSKRWHSVMSERVLLVDATEQLEGSGHNSSSKTCRLSPRSQLERRAALRKVSRAVWGRNENDRSSRNQVLTTSGSLSGVTSRH